MFTNYWMSKLVQEKTILNTVYVLHNIIPGGVTTAMLCIH